MCNYALDLATSIINLEFNKNKVLGKDKEVRRLCHCRREMLENYILAAQLLYVRVTARTLKFLEDPGSSAITLNTEDLKTWFQEQAYGKMIAAPDISSKMVVLFRELQSLMDKQFFEFFDVKYADIVRIKLEGVDEDSFAALLGDFYNQMLHWFETAIFNILTLRIDCHKIDASIFEDYGIPADDFCCDNVYKYAACIECKSNTCIREGCQLHSDTAAAEDLHLYIIDEMLSTKGWLERYISLFEKYHNNLKEVDFIFDYKMYTSKSPLTFTEDNCKALWSASMIFKSVQVINYRGVNFGDQYNCVKPFLAGA